MAGDGVEQPGKDTPPPSHEGARRERRAGEPTPVLGSSQPLDPPTLPVPSDAGRAPAERDDTRDPSAAEPPPSLAPLSDGPQPGEVIDDSQPTVAGPPVVDGPSAEGETPVEPTSGGLAQPPEVGTRLRYVGDYELLRKLAQGGMGVVYRAWQLSLSRPVAVKLILAGQLASADAVQRFRREAEAVARLEHPGIVPIYEIGHEQGHYFFSMPLVDGESLAQRVLQGPLPHSEAAVLVRKVAEAMGYAHAAGVVHRDLKPGNILVDRQGEPKVIDFGLARRVETDSTLTSTGMIIGTPSYMSPEQAQGEGGPLGPLTDVYSLGAVLYCLLTGRPPFQAATAFDTVRQVVEQEPVAVSALNPAVPLDLETICHKCLQKDPARRYVTAQALAEDLRRWERGEPITARPVSTLERGWRWVRRNPVVSSLIATTVAAILLGTGASLWFGSKATKEADIARRNLARSNYFLAQSRWKEGRVAEARGLLGRVPKEHRNIEWGLAAREFAGSELTLTGHTEGVNSLAYSPDGTRIVSGSYDKTLKVWDAATGQATLTLGGHTGCVYSVAYSPDSTGIVSGSGDNTLKVWDAATGQATLTLTGHDSAVSSVAYSPDGTRIVSGSDDNTLKVWDAGTGQATLTLTGHTGWVYSVAFSPDGTRIVSGSEDNTLKVWDAATGQMTQTLTGHARTVRSVAYSPDGTRIVSGSGDYTLKVWNVATGQATLTLIGHTGWVTSVAYSPDGTRIVSGSDDNTLKVWDAATGQEMQTLTGHARTVRSVAYSPDGTRVVSGSDGTRIDTGSDDNILKVWDATSGQATLTLSGHTGGVTSVAYSPDGTRIVSGSDDNTLKVWEAATGQEMQTLTGHASTVRSVAYSPDGKRIISGGGLTYGTLKLWDVATGQLLRALAGHRGAVTSVAYSPDGTRIVSGSHDKTVKVWDAATGQVSLTLTGHDEYSSVWGVAYSPDGTRIISGGGWMYETLKVWDAATGQATLTLTGHTGTVKSVAYSPNGTRLVSGSLDNTLKIWNVATGQATLTLSGHTGDVTSVAYSPDGTRIVSGSEDKTLKLWDGLTGEELCTLTGHRGAVTDVCFSPDGTRIVSASEDGTIRFWDTSFYRPDERALRYFAAPRPDRHREQAKLLEASNNLYAALFHRAWLLKIQPDDPQLYNELHAAHDRWKATTDGKDVPLPPVVREMLAVPRGKSGTP